MNRVHSIDYLRGVLAFLIMIYHYSNWENIFIPDASSFLAIIAIYGVSLFFIISGFSLTVTYIQVFNSFSVKNILKFFLKRFARIYPLFWLITSIYLSLIFFSGKDFPDIYQIISNLTISFSFFSEYSAFTPGGWSIGIEIFLYVFFPFLILFLNKYVYAEIILILFILTSIYISAYLLYDISAAKDYWNKYLNLINHVYFFIFGMIVGSFYYRYNNFFKINKSLIEITSILLIIIFIYYPIEGEVINLLLGENRIILTAFVFLIFLLIVMYNPYLNYKSRISRTFNFFGDISYTLYLLHPIIYMIINHFININSMLKVILMMLLTVIASSIIYMLFEIKAQNKILFFSIKHV